MRAEENLIEIKARAEESRLVSAAKKARDFKFVRKDTWHTDNEAKWQLVAIILSATIILILLTLLCCTCKSKGDKSQENANEVNRVMVMK